MSATEPSCTRGRPGDMPPGRRRNLAIVAILAALLPAGCLGTSAGTTLDGREFVSVRVTEDGADRALVPGSEIRLRFADGQLGAQAGCNSYGGAYEIRDGRLVTDGGAMTEMGCDAPRHAQDDWLFAFLGARPAIGGTGPELVLSDGTTTIALVDRETARPDVGLVGRVWLVDAVVAGDAVASLPAGTEATLQFAEDGQVAIFAGCNQIAARAEIDGDRMRFRDIVSTDMACPGAAGRLEADLLEVLRAEQLTFHIDENRLELSAPGMGLHLSQR